MSSATDRLRLCALFAVLIVLIAAAPASAATFYVAPGGGGSLCSVGSPCGSIGQAYGLAAPGDVVSVAGGTYGSQVLSGDKGSSTPVTVQVAAGQTAQLNGSFGVRADYVRVVGPFVVSSGFNVDDSDQSNEIVGVFAEKIDAGPSLVENARDLVVRNSSFGGVDGRKPLQTGAWPTSHRVTFDGVYFHDAAPTDATQHLECLTISGVQGITIRNSLFRRCGFFGILAGNGNFAGGAPDVRDFVLENNVFERTLCWANSGGCAASGSEDSNPNTGSAPYSLMFGADPFINVSIRNNAFQTEPSINKPSYTNARFVGNVGAHGLCVSGLTYRYNVLTSGPCGTGDVMSPGVLSGYDSNWRLTSGSSPAVGAADPSDVPASDREGVLRDSDPDAGPDEWGVGGTPTPADTQAPSAPTGLSATGSQGQVALSWSPSSDNVGVVHYNVHRSTSAGFTPSATNRVGQPAGTSFTDAGRPAGQYFYRVAAQDAAGNVSSPSAEASATATADTSLPVVAITAPAAATIASGTVAMTANATDDNGVAAVQFKVDGQNAGSEDATAPYSRNWDSTAVANGGHTITAVARDATGNTATSAAVQVTVTNLAPDPDPVPDPNPLVAAYGFEEPSGTNVSDESGRGNDGTISGATHTLAGRYGNALSFDGVNDMVSVADSSSLDLGSGMTLSAWVRPATVAGWRSVLLKEHTGRLVYALYGSSDSTLPGGAVYTGSYHELQGAAAVPMQHWTHLAASYDGTTMRLYVDGTQVSTQVAPGTITSSGGALRLGGNALFGEWFNGLIDDVRVYSRALSPGEIQSDMTSPVVPGTPAGAPDPTFPLPPPPGPEIPPPTDPPSGGPKVKPPKGPKGGPKAETALVTSAEVAPERICARPRGDCRQAVTRLRFRVSDPGTVIIRLERQSTSARSGRARTVRRAASRGANLVLLRARTLKPGHYRIVITPAAGGRSASVRMRVG
jgi:hypothetical protein